MLLDDRAGGGPEVARAPVVAEARPLREHIVLRRGGKRPHVGEALQESPVAVAHDLHPRLLEHHFRHEDAVGVLRATPGEIAPAPVVPSQELSPEGGRRNRGGTLPGRFRVAGHHPPASR